MLMRLSVAVMNLSAVALERFLFVTGLAESGARSGASIVVLGRGEAFAGHLSLARLWSIC